MNPMKCRRAMGALGVVAMIMIAYIFTQVPACSCYVLYVTRANVHLPRAYAQWHKQTRMRRAHTAAFHTEIRDVFRLVTRCSRVVLVFRNGRSSTCAPQSWNHAGLLRAFSLYPKMNTSKNHANSSSIYVRIELLGNKLTLHSIHNLGIVLLFSYICF